jgi:triphosphoribosyl-dephospho-CoA synthase
MGTSVLIADDLFRTDLQRTDLLNGDPLRKNRHCSPRAAERSRLLAALASQSLIAEAELTPKPGLVDRRGSGAHHDLSLDLMRLSASVLEPYFVGMSSTSVGRDADSSLRQDLAAIGREAEGLMRKVTHGINTHKGAIWNLGLLIAAAARRESQTVREIAAAAGAIARLPDRPQPELMTHGDMVRNRYGATGARGEASNGFPHVVEFGLPILRERRAASCSEEICRLDGLLSLMSQVDDTCVLYRGGSEALSLVKSGAQAILMAGGYGSAHGRKLMRELDGQLIARHISPGGSADLLAATIFLDAVEREHSEIGKDQSEWEEFDGAA